jgi:putative nucleotidyltransferase with HDIG domain
VRILFDWLDRKKLIRQGLASDRTRRQTSDDGLRVQLNSSSVVKALILLAFGGFAFFLAFWGTHGATNEMYLLMGILFASSIMLLRFDVPEAWASNSKLLLLLGTIWFNIFVTKNLYLLFLNKLLFNLPEVHYLVPGALAPLILGVLFGPRAGLYAVLQVSLFSALLLEQNFAMLLIGLITGFTAVYFTRNVRKRSTLIQAGVAVGAASLLCALAFGILSGRAYAILFQQACVAIGTGIITAMAVNAILPVMESFFDLTTDITWLELSDLNHPLLRQMTIEAPGTYHHSLVVANLAEAAADAIGANSAQTRVLAYFHDIGKIIKPEYFAENIPQNETPHESLAPNMSALIIIAHVKEGVDLALKYGLKRPIIDAIQQHHGDSLVYFFYKKARQQAEDARLGGKIMNLREDDVPDVEESTYRYPGPRPHTKEIGLLMLADAIEGASRSLEKPTPSRIESLVTDIIRSKYQDNQLDDCPLSTRDLATAAESFTFTLKNMLHSRIHYPKDERSSSSAGVQPAKRHQASSGQTTEAA